MAEPNATVKTLTGRGLVSAHGCEAVRVRYRVRVERRGEALVAHGTLHGSAAGLRPIWLEPDAQLRLKDGIRFGIAVTDLVGDAAEFESTGPLPDL